MPWKYTEQLYKTYTLQTWDECADKYSPVMKQLAPFHSLLLDRLHPHSGQNILDVASGPGEPAMSIAELVAPDGHVTGIDLSPNMVKIAKRNARDRNLRNIDFRCMDAEKLEFASEHFDAATCCFGFQIIPNPEAAAKEVLRVLKPGGRIALTVWSSGERAPALDVIIAPMLEFAEPDEDGYLPTPFEMGGQGELVRMLEGQGFVEAEEMRTTGFVGAKSVEDYLNIVFTGTPLGHSLGEESPKVQKKILDQAKRNIKRYNGSRGIRIPAEGVLVIAAKPN